MPEPITRGSYRAPTSQPGCPNSPASRCDPQREPSDRPAERWPVKELATPARPDEPQTTRTAQVWGHSTQSSSGSELRRRPKHCVDQVFNTPLRHELQVVRCVAVTRIPGTSPFVKALTIPFPCRRHDWRRGLRTAAEVLDECTRQAQGHGACLFQRKPSGGAEEKVSDPPNLPPCSAGGGIHTSPSIAGPTLTWPSIPP
jgi:hypothetical protein